MLRACDAAIGRFLILLQTSPVGASKTKTCRVHLLTCQFLTSGTSGHNPGIWSETFWDDMGLRAL